MKRLNNKGFAISTLLYGILTMVILILALILTLMRTAYNEKNAVVDDELTYLNNCAKKLANLNACYRTYDYYDTKVSCKEEYQAYTTCVGYNYDDTSSSFGLSIEKLLIGYNSTDSGLVLDETDNKGISYVFVGENPNNYITFGGLKGRIISLKDDGEAKVILSTPVSSNVAFDSEQDGEEKDRWEKSKLYNTLKNYFNRMNYTSYLSKYEFPLGTIYSSDNFTLYKSLTNSASILSSSVKFGTLSVSDYIKASGNTVSDSSSASATCCIASTCTSKVKLSNLSSGSNACNKKNWIQSTYKNAWTLTSSMTGEYYYLDSSGNLKEDSYTSKHDAYIVINLSNKVYIRANGDGTEDNPYIVETK